jgi:hypothetical protein
MLKLLICVVTIVGVCSTFNVDTKITIYPKDDIIYISKIMGLESTFKKISQTPAYPEFILENGILYIPKNLVVGSVFQFKVSDIISKILTVTVGDYKIQCVNINRTTTNVIQMAKNYSIITQTKPPAFDITNGLITVVNKLSSVIYILSLSDNITLYITIEHPNFCNVIPDNTLTCDTDVKCVDIDNTTIIVTQLNVSSTKNVTYSIIDGAPKSTFAVDSSGLVVVMNKLLKSAYKLTIRVMDEKNVCIIILYISVKNPEFCLAPNIKLEFKYDTQCVEYTSSSVIQVTAVNVEKNNISYTIIKNTNFAVNNSGIVTATDVLTNGTMHKLIIRATDNISTCSMKLYIGVNISDFCLSTISVHLKKSKINCYLQCIDTCHEYCHEYLAISTQLPIKYRKLCHIRCNLLC